MLPEQIYGNHAYHLTPHIQLPLPETNLRHRHTLHKVLL